MKAILCYETKSLSDLSYYEKSSNIVGSFDHETVRRTMVVIVVSWFENMTGF